MKTSIILLQIEEKRNGDIFWNVIVIEKLGESMNWISEDVYNITPNLQNVFTDTTNKSLEKLDDNVNKS